MVGDISDNIEQFAKNMFLSAVDQHVTDAEYSQSGTTVQRTGEVCAYFVFAFKFSLTLAL